MPALDCGDMARLDVASAVYHRTWRSRVALSKPFRVKGLGLRV